MALGNAQIIGCDILVIGGGGAGLRAAIEAKENGADVVLVSKARVGYMNNTLISKGHLAAATNWIDPNDTPDICIKDAIVAGRFLNDQGLLAAVAQGAEEEIFFLEKCGVPFLRREGKLWITSAPGHTYPRLIRSRERKGGDIIFPLRKYACRIGIRFVEKVFINRLFAVDERIVAATGITKDGRFFAFSCSCLILATGGFGQIYLNTNNAAGIEGDGQALAYELGASLKDMEFVQFYPTEGVVYEFIVGRAGAVLRNADGTDILKKYNLSPSTMTRDALSRAIMNEILLGKGVKSGVILDLGAVSEEQLASELPMISSMKPLDRKEFIVHPTTHYCMGGIIINENAETSISGLFAAGEVCAGVNGANRISGHGLSEAFVLGAIAGKNAALKAKAIGRPQVFEDQFDMERARIESYLSKGHQNPKEACRSLREIMWYGVGIIREKEGLEAVLKKIRNLNAILPQLGIEDLSSLIKCLKLRNMLIVAEMICKAALMRNESRGAHFRSDYPEENNDHWLKNIVIRRKNSLMDFEAIPVSFDQFSAL